MPLLIRNPEHGYVERAYTLDDLIARLEELRSMHGGGAVVACVKDSSGTLHLLDGDDTVADYCGADEAWDPESRHRGPAIMLSIND